MWKALVRSSQVTILRGYQQIAVAQSAIALTSSRYQSAPQCRQ
jgi:ActR/RegA family two-component response regulator